MTGVDDLWRQPHGRVGRPPVLRPPPPAHRVLDARRGGADRRSRRRRGRRRPARARDHRPREHVRRPRVLRSCHEAGISPIIGTRGVHGAQLAPRATGAPGPGRRHRRRRGTGREALLPPDRPRRDERRLPQPDEALVRRLPRGLLLQAAGRLGAARTPPRGADRDDRLPRRRRRPGGARRRHRRGPRARRAGSRRSSGRENLFVELQDHGIADQRRVNPTLVEIARAIRAPLLATNDGHYCRRGDAVAHDALLCVQTGRDDRRPEAVQVRGRRALPEDRRRDADALPGPAGSVRQHARRRRARPRRDRARQADAAGVPGARRVRRRHVRGVGDRVPRRPHDARRRRALRRAAAGEVVGSGSTTSSASSRRWGSRPTSSSCGTSSATPAR